DSQSGGSAIADGNGHYHIDGVSVGAINVTAALGVEVGSGAGRIVRAGSTANVDVTLVSGSVSASGQVLKIQGEQHPAVPGVSVVYYVEDVPVGVTTTDAEGKFAFNGMPSGAFAITAALNQRDTGTLRGTGHPGDRLSGLTVKIEVQPDDNFGTVSG